MNGQRRLCQCHRVDFEECPNVKRGDRCTVVYEPDQPQEELCVDCEELLNMADLRRWESDLPGDDGDLLCVDCHEARKGDATICVCGNEDCTGCGCEPEPCAGCVKLLEALGNVMALVQVTTKARRQ